MGERKTEVAFFLLQSSLTAPLATTSRLFLLKTTARDNSREAGKAFFLGGPKSGGSQKEQKAKKPFLHFFSNSLKVG